MRWPSFLPKWLVPKPIRTARRLYLSRSQLTRRLLVDYGWIRSFHEDKCVDREGRPVPYFTYPAIDFLSQLDLSGRSVFEYGSGASTLFWAGRARSVISVESNPEWHQRVTASAPSNVEVLLRITESAEDHQRPRAGEPPYRHRDPETAQEVEKYASAICGKGKFDVIVVDGVGNSRPRCSQFALEHVKAGGIIILDNSDQSLKSAAILRGGGLIQADFTGFAPLNSIVHCTSVFFTREYNFQATGGHQPHRSVGQPGEPWPGN